MNTTQLQLDCAKVQTYLADHGDTSDSKIITDCKLSNTRWLKVRHALLTSKTIATIGQGEHRKYMLLPLAE